MGKVARAIRYPLAIGALIAAFNGPLWLGVGLALLAFAVADVAVRYSS